MTARKGTSSLAEVLQELELRQPAVVTTGELRDLLAQVESSLSPREAAERLVREGWLSPLRTRNAWEFVPAARAGRIPSGDPWIELRAYLAHHSVPPVAIGFASAVWKLGFSSHPPSRNSFVFRRGWRKPLSLRGLAGAQFGWRLQALMQDGLPILRPASILVATAHLPRHQSNWGNADDWLPETMRAATPDEIATEAIGRGTATLVRLSYLAEWSGRVDITAALSSMLPETLPVTYLGPREGPSRWVNDWRIRDSLLPER